MNVAFSHLLDVCLDIFEALRNTASSFLELLPKKITDIADQFGDGAWVTDTLGEAIEFILTGLGLGDYTLMMFIFESIGIFIVISMIKWVFDLIPFV